MNFRLSSTRQSEGLPENRPCPLCSSTRLTPFLRRSAVPVLTNLLMATPEAARQVHRGDIHLVVCEHCGFVFNSAFTSSTPYNEHYDNAQAYAPSFEHYLDGLVSSLVATHHIQHCHILEVGCGDGLFLRKLVEAGTGNTGQGFDPSYYGPFSALDGRVQFTASYYDGTCDAVPADILICRHVIEHISNPLPFLRTLHHALAVSPHTRAFFETPTIEWILQNNVMWDIYYEHCSYFRPETITLALECSGFIVTRIQRTFEGQYLWIEATVRTTEQASTIPTIKPGSIPSLASQFQVQEQQFCEQWKQTIQALRHDGPVALIGCAGKGVTFANLIDPDCQLITCIADLNPRKQQKFLPGTGHPIVSYEMMKLYGITSALVMNPNYYGDTLQLLDQHQLPIKLIVDHVLPPTLTENK